MLNRALRAHAVVLAEPLSKGVGVVVVALAGGGGTEIVISLLRLGLRALLRQPTPMMMFGVFRE
jgi:hypothetical protein